MVRSTCIVLTVALLVLGCARVEVKKVGADDKDTDGLRFYRPWPYLLVTQEKGEGGSAGSLKASLIYLPKADEQYVLRTRGVIGTVNAKCTLAHGLFLTEFGEIRDSKVPEMIKEIAGLVTAIPGLGARRDRFGDQPQPAMIAGLVPGLWRFTFNEDGHVEALEAVHLFWPVRQPEPNREGSADSTESR